MQSQSITLPFDNPSFWANVDFNGPVPAHCPELGPCWVWTAHRDKCGYGTRTIYAQGKRRTVFAHRYAYQAIHGALSPVIHVCHACDNPACVNPAHLWPGTVAENNADRDSKGHIARGEQHCRHRLTADDVRTIRLRRAEGRSCPSIARTYGVAISTIQDIIAGVTWKSVT